MIRCPNCMTVNEADARFCGGCGQPLMEAGVDHVGNRGAVAGAAGQGEGNYLPTIPETETPGPGGLGPGEARVGGAAQATVLEGPGGRGPVQGGGFGGPAAGGRAGRTVIHEEVVRPLAGWLVVLRTGDPSQTYREIPLFRGKNMLGRETEPAHQIDGPGVSRQHAAVKASASGCRITDISTGGTIVNHKPIDETVKLERGDLVRIGKTRMVFVPMPAAAD